MFPQILKQWFWDCYDHLGRLLLANMLLFFILAAAFVYTAPIIVAFFSALTGGHQVLFLAAAFLVVAPLSLTLAFAPFSEFAPLVSKEKDPRVRVFLRGLWRQGFRTWRYFFLVCLILALLLVNIWFYTLSGQFPESMMMVGYILAGLCFWLGVVLAASLVPGIPLLFRRELGAGKTLKISLLVLLKYPGLVFGLFIFLVSLWIIGTAVKMAGLLIFAFSGTAMMLNSFYDVVAEWEEAMAREAEESDDKRPRTWKELKDQEKETEEERMRRSRYERTFRDIIRPWEG